MWWECRGVGMKEIWSSFRGDFKNGYYKVFKEVVLSCEDLVILERLGGFNGFGIWLSVFFKFRFVVGFEEKRRSMDRFRFGGF